MKDYTEFSEIIAPLLDNADVLSMKNYIQHGNISTFEHCMGVAKASCFIGSHVPFRVDMTTLLQGAILHDFYLYDWHEVGDGSHRMHGFRHAKRAAENAASLLSVSDSVYSVIYTHMWPLNPFRIPRSREAMIVCMADKCVALYETLFRR